MNRLTIISMLLGLLPLPAYGEELFVRPAASIVVMAVLGVALVGAVVVTSSAAVRVRRAASGSDPVSGVEEGQQQKKRLIVGAISIVLLSLLLVFAWQWKVERSLIVSPEGAPSSVSVEGGIADIVDHQYPDSGVQGVARNASIYVWFALPIERSSIIDDRGTQSQADDVIRDDRVRIQPLVRGVRARSNSVNTIFAFDPIEPLGSALRKQVYTVELRNLQTADGRSAFGTNGFYRWGFTVGRTSDTSGPQVAHVFPDTVKQPAAINSGIQIEWNEGVDPLSFTSGLIVSKGDQEIRGVWEVANGERLTEFFASTICGVNACRREVTCFPPSSTITVGQRSVDARAYPRQGVRDLNGNRIRSSTRALATIRTGESVEQSTPTIVAVDPPPNASGVTAGNTVRAQFSSVLRATSVNRSGVRLEGDGRWTARVGTDFKSQTSTITIDHEKFLPEAVVRPSISFDVQDIHQNCFVQCKGP